MALNLLLKSQELSLFSPVTECLDEAGEEDRKVDRDRLNPFHVVAVTAPEDGEDEEDGREDEQELDVELIDLVEEDGPE